MVKIAQILFNKGKYQVKQKQIQKVITKICISKNADL